MLLFYVFDGLYLFYELMYIRYCRHWHYTEDVGFFFSFFFFFLAAKLCSKVNAWKFLWEETFYLNACNTVVISESFMNELRIHITDETF